MPGNTAVMPNMSDISQSPPQSKIMSVKLSGTEIITISALIASQKSMTTINVPTESHKCTENICNGLDMS